MQIPIHNWYEDAIQLTHTTEGGHVDNINSKSCSTCIFSISIILRDSV